MARTASVLSVSLLALTLLVPTALAGPEQPVIDVASQAIRGGSDAAGALCTERVDELRDMEVTHDNNTTTDSWMEWDNLKGHGCGELRDDLQRTVYEEAGTPSTFYQCSSYMTPWTTCVGLNLEGCDLWVSWLTWQCFGGLFPDNTPK